MIVHSLAPEVRTIAQRLIDKYHPDLRAIRIEYVFRSKAAKRHGRQVRGTAQKVTGVHALLATPMAVDSEDLDFFLVTIAQDLWERMGPRERDALVDHELNHLRVVVDEDGDATLVTVGHDIEAFGVEVGRHGLWSPELEWFVTSLGAEQLEFVVPGASAVFADGSAEVARSETPGDDEETPF